MERMGNRSERKEKKKEQRRRMWEVSYCFWG